MKFIDKVLQAPSYGWQNENNELVIPSSRVLFTEAFSKINIFKTKKNWISFIGWFMLICMIPFFYFFLFKYFSLWLLVALIVYAMVIMSTHGTIWFHRYCTHKAFEFSHPIWRFITKNLVIKTIPEEMYIVSHHVHHAKSDNPGDPYNAKAGLLYCMLADVNHQCINKELDETEYKRVSSFLKHTGVKINTYAQYLKWGSIASPLHTILSWLLNWAFWFAVLYYAVGPGFACALFSGAAFWVIFVRAFNYTSHGKGKIKHKDGIDFDRSNLSINQTRPGWVSGEWHNNHHLYPTSARAGFLPYQLDIAWVYIYCLYKLGAISSYRDSKKNFLARYNSQSN